MSEESASSPFFTIGHSSHSFAAFVELLRASNVQQLVDVRKIPKSRANPQFNQDALASALADFEIAYEHVTALGGFRGKALGLSADVNGFWQNKSFRNYADYALSHEFQGSLHALIELGLRRRCAVMCSEAVWWRCHRRLIADNLLAHGQTVLHIMGQGKIETARLTPGAVIRPDKTVVYPCPDAMGG